MAERKIRDRMARPGDILRVANHQTVWEILSRPRKVGNWVCKYRASAICLVSDDLSEHTAGERCNDIGFSHKTIFASGWVFAEHPDSFKHWVNQVRKEHNARDKHRNS